MIGNCLISKSVFIFGMKYVILVMVNQLHCSIVYAVLILNCWLAYTWSLSYNVSLIPYCVNSSTKKIHKLFFSCDLSYICFLCLQNSATPSYLAQALQEDFGSCLQVLGCIK